MMKISLYFRLFSYPSSVRHLSPRSHIEEHTSWICCDCKHYNKTVMREKTYNHTLNDKKKKKT